MKHLMCITAIGALLATSCATVQEPWNGQTFAQGAPQPADEISNSPWSPSTNSTPESGLVNILVDRFGINSTQAMGGVGSVFALAQQRMDPADFMQLKSSVPDMDRYLSAVPKPASSIAWQSSASDLMGNEVTDLGSLAALTGSFRTLGMDANMINQFVPVVLQYVQGQSGLTATSLLQNALY